MMRAIKLWIKRRGAEAGRADEGTSPQPGTVASSMGPCSDPHCKGIRVNLVRFTADMIKFLNA